jgi:hypothetical protein
VTLCNQHIEELDSLEKRRFNEKAGIDREELMHTTGGDQGPRKNYGERTGNESPDRQALFEGATSGKYTIIRYLF